MKQFTLIFFATIYFISVFNEAKALETDSTLCELKDNKEGNHLTQFRSRRNLFRHLNQDVPLQNIRAATSSFKKIGGNDILMLKTTGDKKEKYAWIGIPAPENGWSLEWFKAIEFQIRNTGKHTAHILTWAKPTHGWDAVCDTGDILPGKTRTFIVNLQETFPDGTRKLDPTRINELLVMCLKPERGTTLEIFNVYAAEVAHLNQINNDRIEVPEMQKGIPQAGLRVEYVPEHCKDKSKYIALYLPVNWDQKKSLPLIVEFPGNIFFVKDCYSSGRPEQCVIGYGMSKGKDAIWMSLPFVDYSHNGIAESGWGNPDHTADFAEKTVDEILRKYGADQHKVILAGFSRGAIACGFIGLRNQSISSRWKGIHACQHYDGDGWGGSNMTDAKSRLKNFRGFSIFQTDNNKEKLRQILMDTSFETIFVSSGLGAHSCAMFLDDRKSTQQLRNWFSQLVE